MQEKLIPLNHVSHLLNPLLKDFNGKFIYFSWKRKNEKDSLSFACIIKRIKMKLTISENNLLGLQSLKNILAQNFF